jgi:hypothetical protein
LAVGHKLGILRYARDANHATSLRQLAPP